MKNRPLKILMLTWELYPLMAGGLGPLIRSAVDELRAQGCDVTVLLPNIPEEISVPDAVNIQDVIKKSQYKNCHIPEFGFNPNLFLPTSVKKITGWPKLFSKRASATRDFGKIIYPNNTPALTREFALKTRDYLKNTKEKYDVIIGTDWLTIATFFVIKKEFDIPFVFYVNSTEFDRSYEKVVGSARTIMTLEKNYFKKADGVIAISEVTKRILMNKFNVPSDKITIVNDDIEFKPEGNGYKELKKGKNILFIGRVEKQKGLIFLIEAVQKIIEIDPQVRLIVAGDGSLIPWLIEQIAEKGLEKNVLLTGWVSSREKKQLYLSSDLFVMPSQSEPFGLTPLEAIRSDVPVISSDGCGFLGVVPSTPTFKYHDTNKFFQLMRYYLNDKEAASQLLKSQQEDLSRHSWSKEIGKMIDMLHSLKEKKGTV